jgi:hypothetical protein
MQKNLEAYKEQTNRLDGTKPFIMGKNFEAYKEKHNRLCDV